MVAFDRNAAALDSVVADLGPRCVAVAGDVSARADCERAVQVCVREFGRIDVMCAHAGIADPLALLEMTDEHWRRHMAVNVDGTMHCIVAAARAMAPAGGGAIVCTSSINAWFVEQTHAVYNVTKAAVWALIRSAAIDLAEHRIRVNGVAPGVVDTPLAALVVQDPVLAPEYLKTIPLGRFADPADIASCVAFLASARRRLHHRADDRDRRRSDARHPRQPGGRLRPPAASAYGQASRSAAAHRLS